MICQSSTKLTLRSAYERYLAPEHKPRTRETYGSLLNHWEAAELSIAIPEEGALVLRVEARDPDVAAIDNLSLLDFKHYLQAAARKLKQNSIRSRIRGLNAIFARLGPEDRKNPEGLGILPRVYYVKAPAEILRRVIPIEDADVERLYQAAEIATWPDCEVDPVLWWRSLIVNLFNLGLRRSDYLSMRRAEYHLGRGVLVFDAEKTGKESELPLHESVIEHLRAIWEPQRALVWPWRHNQLAADPIDRKKTSLYAQWHRIRKAAGIAREVTPHDLRRTCGSALFFDSPAAASECLQHSSITTTQRSYANCSRETRELMLNRKQPPIFGLGEAPAGMIIRFPAG